MATTSNSVVSSNMSSNLSSNISSIMSSNMSFPYTATSINSYKSRKNVLYPRRAHPPPLQLLPVKTGSPDVLTWEVRYLCANLLPRWEVRLLPAGTVLLRSLNLSLQSNSKNEEGRLCSELFILLTHEILLKYPIGVELDGPCKLLDLTFSNILFKSRAPDTPTTSNLNETSLQAPRVETHALERYACVLRTLRSVMNVFKSALDTIGPPTVSDEVRHQVPLGFSTVHGLTMDQFREVLDQKLGDDPESLIDEAEATQAIIGMDSPNTIADSEDKVERDSMRDPMNPKGPSHSGFMIRKHSLLRKILCRFPRLSSILLKTRDMK